jgi:carboxylesterase type B
MVWIHGGAFVTGSGTSVMFGPDHLLTEDIVFVSINYRLGVLGIANINIYLRKPLHVCMRSGMKE